MYFRPNDVYIKQSYKTLNTFMFKVKTFANKLK